MVFCMGVEAPQLLSRSRENTLDAWYEALSAGPRPKGADLLAAVPPGSFLQNTMGVLAFIEVEKMAMAMLLAARGVPLVRRATVGRDRRAAHSGVGISVA